MAKAFTQSTTERGSMDTTVLEKNKIIEKIWTLDGHDLCDKCGVQALVSVKGLEGELMFCGHHYNKIMNSHTGYNKMMGFMIQIIDERDRFK